MTDRGEDYDYETGYGKPPRKSQFKPGQSGNPKGRPKKISHAGLNVVELMNREKQIRINGKRVEATTFEISILRLVERAVNGDFQALKTLVNRFLEYGVYEPPDQLRRSGVMVIRDRLYWKDPAAWVAMNPDHPLAQEDWDDDD